MYLNCIFNPPPPPPYQHRHISIRPSIHHTAAHTTPLPCTYLRNHRPTDRPTDRPNRRTSSASLSLSAAANQKNYPPSLALLALSLATPTVPNPFSILTSFSHSFASLFYPRACQRLILPSSSSSSFTSSLHLLPAPPCLLLLCSVPSFSTASLRFTPPIKYILELSICACSPLLRPTSQTEVRRRRHPLVNCKAARSVQSYSNCGYPANLFVPSLIAISFARSPPS